MAASAFAWSLVKAAGPFGSYSAWKRQFVTRARISRRSISPAASITAGSCAVRAILSSFAVAMATPRPPSSSFLFASVIVSVALTSFAKLAS